MGMAAGQARLLSITARLSDNEANGQALSYSKQRLADETEQLNTNYNNALAATKLQVLTSFNGTIANYSDISYNLMTGYDSVALGRQYIVTDTKGRILVTDKQAKAFEAGNGDFNIFLAELGYTQADLTATSTSTDEAAKNESLQKIHDAWDKYFTSIGITFDDEEHEYGDAAIEFGYQTFNGDNTLFNGYPTYTITRKPNLDKDGNPVLDENGNPTWEILPNPVTNAINYEGTTKEQRELYDYAIAITSQYYSDGTYDHVNPDDGKVSNNLLQTANDIEKGYIDYLRNIFNKMASDGYYTEENENDTIKDDVWFEQQITEGKLLLEYYSATEKGFVSTTISDDDAIQEVEDDREIARVEAKYNQDLASLEKKDSIIDLELKKLDTEHNALQTEYESVKSVVDKNVEKSFNIFS